MAACISPISAVGRDLAGADRPDRLVGDREVGLARESSAAARRRAAPRRSQPHRPASRTSRLSPTQRITPRPHASAASALALTSVVALALGLAPLGMADDRQRRAGIDAASAPRCSRCARPSRHDGRPARRSRKPGTARAARSIRIAGTHSATSTCGYCARSLGDRLRSRRGRPTGRASSNCRQPASSTPFRPPSGRAPSGAP